MTSWFSKSVGPVKKSPRTSPAPKQTMLNSGSLERSLGRSLGKLESNVEGLYNPLAWENMPSSLQQKFPHWKESSRSFSQSSQKEDSPDDDRALFSVKNTKQPPCTIPYVVMDRDSIQSIAVKFETTPSEIARINKKPTLTFSIFPGDVLYVPDQDELAKLAPPTIVPELPVTDSVSSVESDATPTTAVAMELGGGDKSEGETGREGVELSPEPSPEVADDHISILSKYISEDQGCIHGSLVLNKSTMMFTPNNQDPLVKEHGVEKFEIIIPFDDICYAAITHSCTPPKRRASPSLFSQSQATLTTVSEEHGHQPLAGEQGETEVSRGQAKTDGDGGNMDVDGENAEILENGDVFSEEEVGDSQEKEQTGEEVKEETPLIERTVNSATTNEEGPPTVLISSASIEDDAAQVEPSTSDTQQLNETVQPATTPTNNTAENGPGEEEEEEVESSPDKTQKDEGGTSPDKAPKDEVENGDRGTASTQLDAADDLLAIMGASLTNHVGGHTLHNSESSTDSVLSLDALLADSPYFLHVWVSPKSHHSYTYTPINSSVGIDIPRSRPKESSRDTILTAGDLAKKSRSLSPPVVHHVRNRFCFAVIDKRLDDLIEFISCHHPSSKKDLAPPTAGESWTDEVYEFINTLPFHSNEDLSFEDNHFQSSSWEIYSLKDMPRFCRIDRMEVEYNLPLPNMSESSDLLLEDHIRKLLIQLPSAAVGRDWYLIYSTFTHGISLRTMYRNMMNFENEDSPILLIVRDDQKKLFGAAVTCRIRISEKFYGTGESFLFQFQTSGELKVYPWTGLNNYVVKGNSDSFSIGSGDGHPGLWLDESFYHGASYRCSTFDNDCLASSEDFICSGVEAWGFL